MEFSSMVWGYAGLRAQTIKWLDSFICCFLLPFVRFGQNKKAEHFFAWFSFLFHILYLCFLFNNILFLWCSYFPALLIGTSEYMSTLVLFVLYFVLNFFVFFVVVVIVSFTCVQYERITTREKTSTSWCGVAITTINV